MQEHCVFVDPFLLPFSSTLFSDTDTVVVSVVVVNLFGLLAKLVGSRWYVHTISYCCRNKNSESGIYDLVIDIREHELYLCQW